MGKLKQSFNNLRGSLILLCYSLCALFMGAFLLYLVYSALSSGQLKIPTKSSSRPATIVTPSSGTVFYFGFLLLYAFSGFAFISAPVVIAWRFWRASPYERESMLMTHMSSRGRRPPRILRALLIFVAVPLVAIFIIMFATILKSS